MLKSKQKGFSLLLYQEESGFLFNSDAHFLYDFISKIVPKGRVLDVGCGCGVVGLLLKRDFSIDLTGIDLQDHNIFLSKINARVNALEATFINIDFREFDDEKKFDFIISNPPYYHEGVSKSQNSILQKSKYSTFLELEEFIKRSNSLIKPKGELIFCYDAKQIQNILTLLSKYKFRVNKIRFVYGKMQKDANLVLIEAKKSSNSLCKTEAPLIHFVDEDLSSEAKNIYQKTRTYSIKCKTL